MNWQKNIRKRQKLAVFVKLALDLASLSTCKRRKVGCVIVPSDFSEVFSIGYNGPPAGVNNDSCREVEGVCGCLHAENNALVKLRTRDRDLLLITTCSPCETCAGMVLNSRRVSEVVYVEEYRDRRGLDLLAMNGVGVTPWMD